MDIGGGVKSDPGVPAVVVIHELADEQPRRRQRVEPRRRASLPDTVHAEHLGHQIHRQLGGFTNPRISPRVDQRGGRAKYMYGATATGGTIRLMEKTTLYLPDDLRSAVKRAAAQQGISEAEIIRQSIRQVVGDTRPRPRGGLFLSGQPIARKADEALAGFGER